MSCASCHLPQGNFSDNLATSPGVDGIEGRRSAMVLMDMAFAKNGLFWDGRAQTLEEQALLPVEDPIELHTTWEEVVDKIRNHQDYPERFRRAFGIEQKSQITRDLATKAIAQFERTLIISGNSKYDRVIRGDDVFSDQELAGFEMFFDLNPVLPDAECGHCHNAPLFTTHEYLNNGITDAPGLDDFPDLGFGMVSGLAIDNGKFRVPTLRNIEFSAPYMHDGRFGSLREVIDHYNSGGHPSLNKNELIRPLGLTDAQIDDLLSFIQTLRDEDFINSAAFQDPHN
jgi:cytochrome c peroxidase